MKAAKRERLLRGLFILYCLCMLFLLFARGEYYAGLPYEEQLKLNINLTPFVTIRRYLYLLIHRTIPALVPHLIANLLGNMVMFIPMGFFLPLLFPRQRRFFIFFFTFSALIAAVELTQLFTLRGSCDIDDYILNTLGGLLGWWAGRSIKPKSPKDSKESEAAE